MKPLKIENEAGSNMKSTIRYTFVAPGAIGKGRGRGLKSLGEKGNTPSKSLLPQSSDLVKKYIKEIETSSTEKDKGQGLKRSTIFTSQGMQTIYKNSMVPEKENKQINLSFPTSATKVEKYTQEVETMRPAAIRKGLEKRSGSLSSPLGISESEVGSFNKSVVCANQHMQTPSKSTKLSSTSSSSQEIRKMKNIVLEKEDMQTNVSLSPTINQVMKHSQTTEKGFVDVFGYHMTKTKLYVFCPTFVHSSVNYSLEDAPIHSYFAMNVMQNLGCYLSFLVY
ncbi:hypothetical protein MTR67_013766 [Solanum verrucosum]|uniref:Uncharacterized protein n=1 Tax=Solanum verrucosum TaxID=315347 RepID=A0AAF0QGU9_SOLVR|nr:hypothetical protein MTR67_013766 [Solanum verrucosum]